MDDSVFQKYYCTKEKKKIYLCHSDEGGMVIDCWTFNSLAHPLSVVYRISGVRIKLQLGNIYASNLLPLLAPLLRTTLLAATVVRTKVVAAPTSPKGCAWRLHVKDRFSLSPIKQVSFLLDRSGVCMIHTVLHAYRLYSCTCILSIEAVSSCLQGLPLMQSDSTSLTKVIRLYPIQ